MSGTFALDIARFNIKTSAQLDRVVRGLALRALRGFVLKSPVRSGRFRGNWQVALGAPSNSYDWDLTDAGGGSTVAAGADALKAYKGGISIWITNHLPYAVRLEYGWSQQAPAGMVRVTIAELGGSFVEPDDILAADVGMM